MSNNIVVSGPPVERSEEILTDEALAFVAMLHNAFAPHRDKLLARRSLRREEIARTGTLDYLSETFDIRSDHWQVAPAPADLRDRRVEITGPTDRKMMINALNSGAKVFLADIEDANTPHWHNVISGQVNLLDAARGELAFTSPEGRLYATRTDAPLATIVVRPRGWHMDERHITIDGREAVGALVDFGLHFFHNAKTLLARGSGPYYYLPKMESHLEARLWNQIFEVSQDALGIERGSIRATVLIETIPAAFEMSEILHELREHASGLNAGRWDYLFSIIKYFRDAGAEYVLPDRAALTMAVPFMQSYATQLVRTCHAHGASAIGGMAAFIPSRRDADVNALAFEKVRADKTREAGLGFDGSWVAHPDLVPVAQEIFDGVLGSSPNQLGANAVLTPETTGLLDLASAGGQVTSAGLRANVDVGVRYLAAWLGGLGAVGIHNLMEDAATAEISRSQIWQWCHAGTVLADTGEVVTAALVQQIMDEEAFEDPNYATARKLFEQVALADDFEEFLTTAAYPLID